MQKTVTFIDTIAEHVERGECLLFLGAGVHHGPPESSPYDYSEDQRPLLGGALAERLAEQCAFSQQFPDEDPRDLQRVALCYQQERGRDALIHEIKAAVQDGKRPSAVLRALAHLPFPIIITTNYDKLYEAALYQADKTPVVGMYDTYRYAVTQEHRKHTAQEPFVYKLHGDIQKAPSVVITEEDYIHFILRMSEDRRGHNPVPETFKYNFTRWPTLFIGYSLRDYNLRVIFRTLRWTMDQNNQSFPKTYSIDPYPDQLILAIYQDEKHYVTFLEQDAWTFVPELYRKVTKEEMPP